MKNRIIDLANIIMLILYFAVVVHIDHHWSASYENLPRKNYQCQAAFRLETPELSIPLIAGIRVKDNQGTVMLTGPVYEKEVYTASVNRRIEFEFESDDSVSLFKHVKITKFSKDNLSDHAEINQTVSNILPVFFNPVEDSAWFSIRTIKDGIFFIKDNFPIFYCQYD